MNTALNTIYSRLRLARQQIRRRLERYIRLRWLLDDCSVAKKIAYLVLRSIGQGVVPAIRGLANGDLG